MRHLTTIEIVMSREGDKLLRAILKDFVQEISNHHLTRFVAAQMSHTCLEIWYAQEYIYEPFLTESESMGKNSNLGFHKIWRDHVFNYGP